CEKAPPGSAAPEDLVTGGDVGAHSARQAIEVQGKQRACSVFCAGSTYRIRREEVQVICQGDVAVTEAAAGEPDHDVCAVVFWCPRGCLCGAPGWGARRERMRHGD